MSDISTLDDLDCSAAASELVQRSEDEAALVQAVIDSTRTTQLGMQAAALAVAAIADRLTASPPRTRGDRTIKIVRDEDGAMAAEDTTGKPASEPAPAAPRDMRWDDMFGSI